MEFLKIIILIIAFYYAFKFGMRLLMPFLMKKAAERIYKKAQEQQRTGQFGKGTFFYEAFNGGRQQQEQSRSKPDDKVRVDYVPQKEDARKGTATAGEFVDFEEVK